MHVRFHTSTALVSTWMLKLPSAAALPESSCGVFIAKSAFYYGSFKGVWAGFFLRSPTLLLPQWWGFRVQGRVGAGVRFR